MCVIPTYLQQAQSKSGANAYLLLPRHLQLPDDRQGQTNDPDIHHHVKGSGEDLYRPGAPTAAALDEPVPVVTERTAEKADGEETGYIVQHHYCRGRHPRSIECRLAEYFDVEQEDGEPEACDTCAPQQLRGKEDLFSPERVQQDRGRGMFFVHTEEEGPSDLECHDQLGVRNVRNVKPDVATDGSCSEGLLAVAHWTTTITLGKGNWRLYLPTIILVA